MWNSKSPGVETAWRAPARISRKGCSSAGRGGPKRRSHASDPNPMTQESPPSRSRNSTARTSAARSPQNERRVARFSEPGLSVATRKIAARVSGAATACARAGDLPAASGVLIGSVSIGCRPWWRANFALEMPRSLRARKFARKPTIGSQTCNGLPAGRITGAMLRHWCRIPTRPS